MEQTRKALATGLVDMARTLDENAEVMVQAARTHLGMDAAYITEFLPDGCRRFRHVSLRPDAGLRLRAGDLVPAHTHYCQQVLDGKLPELIPDTSRLPPGAVLPAVGELRIGAHLSVPIRLRDGQVQGTFCCFRAAPDASLNERDLGMMRALADMYAHLLELDHALHREHAEIRGRIDGLLALGRPDMVYQPVYHLSHTWEMSGVECLSRFPDDPARDPADWFREARRVPGLAPRLELAAARRAFTELRELPGDFALFVNVSPETVLSPAFEAVIGMVSPLRLVLELSESMVADDYAALEARLAPLRRRGVRLAVDDAGSGAACLAHILSLHPDYIKLDRPVTAGIDNDWMRHSLAVALVDFAQHVGSTIIAEGVETAAELAALHRIGVHHGQGRFMQAPVPVAELRELLAASAGGAD